MLLACQRMGKRWCLTNGETIRSVLAKITRFLGSKADTKSGPPVCLCSR
jgi:hypothetical protein